MDPTRVVGRLAPDNTTTGSRRRDGGWPCGILDGALQKRGKADGGGTNVEHGVDLRRGTKRLQENYWIVSNSTKKKKKKNEGELDIALAPCADNIVRTVRRKVSPRM